MQLHPSTLILFYFIAIINSGNIQQVIYDFEGTLTSLHVFNPLMNIKGESMHDQLSAFNNCSTQAVLDMFGGAERVAILKRHFEHLKANFIDLGIVSFTHREVILMALIKVGLAPYFKSNKIFGRNQILKYEFQQKNRHRVKSTNISRHFLGFPAENKLFIDNDLLNMQDAARQGVAKIFDIQKMARITNGLSLPQLSWIEAQCMDVSC